MSQYHELACLLVETMKSTSSQNMTSQPQKGPIPDVNELANNTPLKNATQTSYTFIEVTNNKKTVEDDKRIRRHAMRHYLDHQKTKVSEESLIHDSRKVVNHRRVITPATARRHAYHSFRLSQATPFVGDVLEV